MTEQSFLWTTSGTGDGSGSGYSAANLFDIFRALFTGASANAGGVAPDFANELAVSGTSSPVAVASGAAIVYGIPYVNTASVNVTVATPAGATRVDRIVLRADWTAQTVRITRIAGTEGAGAPSMTQSAGATWDIPLANVSITTAGVITVTDTREYVSAVGDGEVDTAKLADNAVTLAKMADNAVNTAELVDAGVTLAKMANLAQSTVIGRAAAAGTGVPTALTAAQLVTILTAADGAGSGLDADLLDGNDSAYYSLYTASSFSVDPDGITDPYRGVNHANMPSSGDWHVLTMRYSTAARLQIAVRAYVATNAPAYYRVYYSGAWQPWIQLITSVTSLAAGSVTATELASNAVTTAKILDDNVTQAKIAAGAVGTTEIATNAVTTTKIADSNVTTAKIADDAVTTDKIAAGSVTATELASNAVTNVKMADNAVGTAELVDAGVTLAKMANLAQSTVIGRAAAAGTGVPTALTAAQLVTILTAADGAGSGLDADTVDGLDLDTSWTSLSVAAAWNSSGSSVLKYRRNGGTVHVQGYLRTAGAGLSSVTVATLPSGYRPPYRVTKFMSGETDISLLAAVVNTNGTIIIPTFNTSLDDYYIDFTFGVA